MLKKKTPIVFLLFFVSLSFSQISDFSSLLIPDDLKENANAVVRYHKTTIDVLDIDKMIVSVDRTITVLNKLGSKDVDAVL